MSSSLLNKMIKKILWIGAVLTALLFCLVSCGGSSITPSLVTDEPSPDNTLGAGDVFDVRVYGEKELSDEFRVSSNGTIDFPLIGTIVVEGKTPTEIKTQLEASLKDGGFLKKPQVSVFVKEYNSKRISVIGQVKKPGNFTYRDGMTVVEAISEAGGFTSMAKKNNTTVIRVVDGKKKKYKTPVEEIGQGKAPNFILRTGDIVFVPERII